MTVGAVGPPDVARGRLTPWNRSSTTSALTTASRSNPLRRRPGSRSTCFWPNSCMTDFYAAEKPDGPKHIPTPIFRTQHGTAFSKRVFSGTGNAQKGTSWTIAGRASTAVDGNDGRLDTTVLTWKRFVDAMIHSSVDIPRQAIARFCKASGIRKLALFGSVLRDDFRPASDIDVLVEFRSDERVGLLRLGTIEEELSAILGRKVDLKTPGFLSPYFRDEVLSEAEVLYDEA